MSATVSSVSIVPLGTDDEWAAFSKSVFPFPSRLPARQILERLRAGGAASAVLETDYIDRDFLEEYAGFYSSVFAQYGRYTRRIHFFSESIPKQTEIDALADVVEDLNKRRKYLGFMIVRPVTDAPIGRTVINGIEQNPSPQNANLHSVLEVRSVFETHLAGARLAINAVPFIQQDNRMSACAQAALWICARHFHNRHSGPWKSSLGINADASIPVDEVVAASLPAGTGGLGTKNIVRGFRALDRQPFTYTANEFDPPKWPKTLRPESVLIRYVRSRIPVIVALRDWEGKSSDGHAIVAVGYTFNQAAKLPPKKIGEKPARHDWSVFATHILVQDDQRGVHLRMPVSSANGESETPYNLKDHCVSIILPLPQNVFVTGEEAERLAWDHLERYSKEWQSLRAKYGTSIPNSLSVAQSAVTAIAGEQVVARTYLTFGWKYKAWVRKNAPTPNLRQTILDIGLPRMVWVTEFGQFSDLNKSQPQRRIFAHAVVDATSAGAPRPPLIMHAPGFLWTRSPTSPSFWATSDDRLFLIDSDGLYQPRQRGP